MRTKKACIKVVTTSDHHAALVEAAKREGLSLNQYCAYMLSLTVASDLNDGFDDLFAMTEQECQQLLTE